MEERKRSIWFVIGASVVLSIGIMMVIADDIESKIPSGSAITMIWGKDFDNTTIWSNGSYNKVLVNGNLDITKNCSSTYYFGNGSYLTGISGSSLPEYWKASLVNTTVWNNRSYNKLLIKANTNITGNTIIMGNCNSTKFYGNASKISNRGGYFGINTQTLSSSKTLTVNTDFIYQNLEPNGANRDITLNTTGAIKGDIFVVRNTEAYTGTDYLKILQGVNILDYIYSNGIKTFIYDGTNWYPMDIATGTGTTIRNVMIGYKAIAYSQGVAIGYQSQGQNTGVGVGYLADGSVGGVAIGFNTRGDFHSVAIGEYAQAKNYNVALGSNALCDSKKYSMSFCYYAKNYRSNEITYTIGGETDQENNIIIIGYAKDTTSSTPIEMFCGDITNQRCTIRPSSVFSFRITVTARDNTANEVAMYIFEGLIKRDASSNTILPLVNKVIIYEDDATWDVNITADDTNEALKITLTGDSSNTVQWVARLDGVETHF